jgi:hypothetical protein
LSSQYTPDVDGVGLAMWLLNLAFSSGPKRCDDVRKFCKERGVTKGELKAARKDLSVFTFRRDGTWYWDEPKENRAELEEEWP